MNIEELLPDGQWVGTQYVIRCPFCGDHLTHNHCYIDVDKRVFFCHFHGEGGALRELLRKCEVDGPLEPREGIVEKKKCDPTDFSQFPKVTGESGTLDILALTYLKNRGLSKEEIYFYDIRFATSGRFYGRVLLPINENNRLVNFVGRSFMECIKPKYLYPKTGETLLTCNEAIFGFDRAIKQQRGLYVLVEGIFDAMRVNKRKKDLGVLGLAVLSKYLSQGQMNKLLRLNDAGFFVMFDSDAYLDAIVTAKKLAAWRLGVRICSLSKGDPDSLSDDEFDAVIRVSRDISFELELEASIND